MNKLQQNFKRRASIAGLVCLLAATFSSCIKNHDNEIDNTPVAGVSVVNASPDALSQDFFLDNNRVNTYPITYGNGLDYFRAYTGKRTAYFYNSGTPQKLVSDTVTLNADKYYTAFLSNLASKPDITILKDTLARPAAGMATIRFVNLSPDAPAADLAVNGGAVLASNKAYRKYSGFVNLQANQTYTLEIRQTGTSTVLVSIPNAAIHAGSVYTIWLSGLAAGSGQTKLTYGVQTNAYYY